MRGEGGGCYSPKSHDVTAAPRNSIYIHRVCQYFDICNHVTLRKSHEVTAKSSDDRSPSYFFK